MNNTAIIYDDIFLKHNTGNHPENPQRLEWLIPAIRNSPLNRHIDWFKPIPATEDEICLVHSPDMLTYIRQRIAEGGGFLDPDTKVSEDSLEAALSAAGAGKLALGLVLSQDYKQVFIPSRPPGHHATSSRSMGFCLFNNPALCAYIALDYKLAEKVAIIDWDIHHGNGTEEIFYTDDRVLVMSVHQFPFFPGTGFAQDTGIQKGEGFNINVPLPEGAGREDYLRAMNEVFAPAVKKFDPDIIIVSAGFDGHKLDPLGGHNLESADYGEIAAVTKKIALDCKAGGRIIAFLEGGYHPTSLPESVLEMLHAWIINGNASHEHEKKVTDVL
ncbi:MAG: histone deacetylase [Firmicutes bacterium]|nr:histone deacetylase [Bacillota bacterium]